MQSTVIITTILVLIFAIFCKIYNVDFVFVNYETNNKYNHNVKMFTNEELSKYNGLNNEALYLSILGTVYDVSKGKEHYGPGQTYHVFTGKDASLSFITGKFDENDVSDDVITLEANELLSLKQWKQFYDKEYIEKGKLIGRYYNENGDPTEYLKKVEDLLKEAEKQKDEKNLDEQLYPPCNISWNEEEGTKVWCTTQSGGIQRSWVGYPRKYFSAGSDSYRCACVEKSSELDPKTKLYENCDIDSTVCYIRN